MKSDNRNCRNPDTVRASIKRHSYPWRCYQCTISLLVRWQSAHTVGNHKYIRLNNRSEIYRTLPELLVFHRLNLSGSSKSGNSHHPPSVVRHPNQTQDRALSDRSIGYLVNSIVMLSAHINLLSIPVKKRLPFIVLRRQSEHLLIERNSRYPCFAETVDTSVIKIVFLLQKGARTISHIKSDQAITQKFERLCMWDHFLNRNGFIVHVIRQ